jgi:D-serine deaminase-like pyridoxal phosphate-dependent protein
LFPSGRALPLLPRIALAPSTQKFGIFMTRRATQLNEAIASLRDHLLTPALVIDLDLVRHNVLAMLKRVSGSEAWRPHIKTVKQAAILDLLADNGVNHTKCATLAELELVLTSARQAGREAQTDALLAYPLYGPSLRALVELRRHFPQARVSTLVDTPDHLREVSNNVSQSGGPRIGIYLDVDMGMHRTGTALERWRSWWDTSPTAAIEGLHAYDGHLHDDQREEAHRCYAPLVVLANAIAATCGPDFNVLVAGTHSVDHALTYEKFWQASFRTQVTPGTIVLGDLRSSETMAKFGLAQAAYVASRLISANGVSLTIDAGSKAISPDVHDRACAIVDARHWQAKAASEEHRIFSCAEAPIACALPCEIGEILWLVPAHVCTTVNLYRRAIYVRAGKIIGEGIIASGHGEWRSTFAQ